MSNLLIATFQTTDAASVTCETATAAGPTINLQRDQPTDLFRSSSLTPTIKIDLGSYVPINLVALLFTNAQQSDTWRIRMALSESLLTSAPLLDTGVIDFSPQDTASDRRHGFLFLNSSITCRWIQIDIDSTGNADGVFDAGRLCVANAYQPSRNASLGIAYGFIDTSQRDRSIAGNTIVNRQGIIPTLDFDIQLDNEAEFYANTYRIQQYCGGSRPVLVITEPDHATLAHEKIYYGLLSQTVRTTNDTYRIFSQRYSIEGMI